MFYIILSLFSILLSSYICWSLVKPLMLSKKNKIILCLGVLLISLSYPCAFLFTKYLNIASENILIGLGFLSFLLFLTIIKDIFRIFAKIFSIKIYHNYISVCILALSLIMTIIAHINATTPQIKHVNIPVSTQNLVGFRIVQISDLHITHETDTTWLNLIVDMVNSQSADIVALTGDATDMKLPDKNNKLKALEKINAKYAKFYVLGNHEYFTNQAEEWQSKMNSLGFTSLLNQNQIVDYKSSKILVAGVTDQSAARFKSEEPNISKAIKTSTKYDISILLAHQPQSIYEASELGIDIQLSGHTHAGQFLPWNFVVMLVQDYFRGLYKIGSTHLYVNQGTGYWGPPIRLGSISEITVIDLISEN